MRIVFSFFFFFFLRFMILQIIFIFSLWNKNFKIIGCTKAKLLQMDCVEIRSDRGSHLQMFFKAGDLKNSAIFTRKHPCLSLFLMKFLFLMKLLYMVNLLNDFKGHYWKKLQRMYFPVNIAKFLRTACITEHWWLLSTWLHLYTLTDWWAHLILIMCYFVRACFRYKKFAATNKQT